MEEEHITQGSCPHNTCSYHIGDVLERMIRMEERASSAAERLRDTIDDMKEIRGDVTLIRKDFHELKGVIENTLSWIHGGAWVMGGIMTAMGLVIGAIALWH